MAKRGWLEQLNPARWRIAPKLSAAFLAAALLPMSLTAYYNLRQSLSSLRSSEYENLELLAASGAARLDQLTTDTQRVTSQVARDNDIAAFTAADPEDRAPLRELAWQAITNVHDSNPDYSSVLLLDLQGKCLLSTNPRNLGKSYAFRDYYQIAVKGKNYISNWIVGSTTGRPGVFFSSPVRSRPRPGTKNPTSSIVGVIVIKLDSKAIETVLRSLRNQAHTAAFLIDRNGIVLSHPDQRWLYHSLVPLTAQTQKQLDIKTQFDRDHIDSLNLPSLAAGLGQTSDPERASYRSPFTGEPEIVGLAPLVSHHWWLAISEPEALFAQPLLALAQRTGISVILVGGGVAILALVLARGIVRPLQALTHGAEQLRLGQFAAAKVDITSHDEVGSLATTFNQMVADLSERQRELNIFGRMVSPEVREKLLNGGVELGGQTCWVSVLFSDIRGFSTISEQMDPQAIVAFLNEYMGAMTEAIAPWGGYVNNFIGDAIVVVFGAPVAHSDCEWRAVSAALAMRDRLESLNQKRQERGEQPIKSGIGISTGRAVAGQIGSIDRLIYTVIGDAVNVAARLEDLTKSFPDYPILMNGATAEALADQAELHLKPLGPQPVKGRAEPVEVVALLPLLDRHRTNQASRPLTAERGDLVC